MIDHGGVVFSGTMLDLLERTSPTLRAAAQHDTDTPRLMQLATDAGYHATRINGAIQIDAPAGWAPDLNRLAWQAGITLRELGTTAADLEQAFFAMTGDHQTGAN